jgi:excisionase family DNA binding protein
MDEQPHESRLLTVSETARLLRLSRAFRYELVACGDIPALHLGRPVVIPYKALERWLDDNSAA